MASRQLSWSISVGQAGCVTEPAGQQLVEDRDEIDDRGAVVGVEICHTEVASIHSEHPGERDADAGSASVVVVDEGSQGAPGRIVPGSAGVWGDVLGGACAEVLHDLEAAEGSAARVCDR